MQPVVEILASLLSLPEWRCAGLPIRSSRVVSSAHSNFARYADHGQPQGCVAGSAAPFHIYGVEEERSAANSGTARTEVGDPLGEFLCRLHFPGWRIGALQLNDPLQQAAKTSLVWLYLVTSGEMEIIVNGDRAPAELRRGDIAIVASEAGHEVRARSGLETPGPAKALFGNFATNAAGGQQLESLLPGIALFPVSARTSPLCSVEFVDWLADEAASRRPGAYAVASRFLLSMLVEAIRTHLAGELTQVSAQVSKPVGPLQGALDPCIGSVLRLVHESPERDWTVHSLARESGLSRSAFADRFRTLVGQPPLQYVTEIRMQKATQLLESTDVPVKRIASLVGYESVSAFSSAYKRRFGCPPIAIRSGGSASSNGDC
jgi:AraC-like DNA-binding protein